MNEHKTFIRRPKRLLDESYMPNLCPMSSRTVINPPKHILIASVTKVPHAYFSLEKDSEEAVRRGFSK